MTEYNLRIRHSSSSSAEMGNSGDPFKHALYRFLGRIDVRKSVSVATKTEDWLWFQLSFVREDDAEVGGEKFGLRDLAKTVVKFGESYFDRRGDRPVYWFQMLCYVGEFEQVSPRSASFFRPRLKH